MQDEKYQQKSQSTSSAEPNYFVHFAMRHPVCQRILRLKMNLIQAKNITGFEHGTTISKPL